MLAPFSGILLFLDGLAEEVHLAPHIILQRPPHEVLHLRGPYLAVRHIQHHRFQKGNHVGTEGEILVHPALRQSGKLRTLLHQLAGQFACLFALHQATHVVQPLDVRTQLLLELRIIGAIHRHLRTDGTLGYRAEIDTADWSVRQHVAEVRLPLAHRGADVVVEPHAHPFAHRTRTHTRLSIKVVVVECQAHQLELPIRISPWREVVEQLDFVHPCIQESLFCLRHTLHESRTRHIRVNLLNHDSLRTLLLVLVRPLCLHILLPLPFTLHIHLVTFADVRHHEVNGLADTTFPSPRGSHQHIGVCRLVQRVVDISEGGLPQVRPQCRKDRVRHSRAVDVGRTAHQQTDKRRKYLGHRRWSLRILRCFHVRTLLTDGQGTLDDARHLLCLYAVARTLHRRHELLLLLAIGGQHLGNPLGIIVADVAQVARHTEDEVVTATDVRTASHLLFECLDDLRVGDVFVGLRVSVFVHHRFHRLTQIIFFIFILYAIRR